MKLLSSVVFLVVMGSALAYKSYEGYQVLRTAPLPASVMPAINKMTRHSQFDFWGTPSVGRPATVMAAPEDVDHLRATLNRLHLAPQTYISDVQANILKERNEHAMLKQKFPRKPRAAVYDRFMEFDEIDALLHELADANPGLVTLQEIADSTEGRHVHALKISSGAGKKSVLIDCALHAREWIGPPVCLRIIEEVIADPALQQLVDWYILPVANPDGYAYAWSDERLWRKTRSPNPGSSCIGTDPNRNFDFLWNTDNNNDICGLTYPGSNAFSEPEVEGLGNFISTQGIAGNLIMYLAIHSYSNLIIYPFGHTNEPVPNAAELQAAGEEAAAAIAAVEGTQYDVGSSGETLYYTYGASDDFAYGVGLVPYAYTFELPGGGPNGFDIPASRIQGVVDETWPGIKVLVERGAAASSK